MPNKLWPYAESGKMFVFSSEGIPFGDEFCCSPPTAVAEKFPGRSISSEKLLICGGRRVNSRCPKSDYRPPPRIEELAARFFQLRASLPGLPIMGSESDIDSAFTRCRLRQDGAVMFGPEFELSRSRGGTRRSSFTLRYLLGSHGLQELLEE